MFNDAFDIYTSWFKRFQQVLFSYRKGLISENDFVSFQMFLLEAGQFNANFTLEEIRTLQYPKSPFALSSQHRYLRTGSTWSMQILCQYYCSLPENTGTFPILVASDLFFEELSRYCGSYYCSPSEIQNLVDLNQSLVSDQDLCWIEIDRSSVGKLNQDIRNNKKIVFYYRDSLSSSSATIPFINMTAVVFLNSSSFLAGCRIVNSLGYRVDPVQVTRNLLRLPKYHFLFFDKSTTSDFLNNFKKIKSFTELPESEKNSFRVLENKILSELENPDILSLPVVFSYNSQLFSRYVDSLIGGFKIYGEYLKNYLSRYVSHATNTTLRMVCDKELTEALNLFFESCHANNWPAVVGSIQTIVEIMQLDLMLYPLENCISNIIQTRYLNNFPVQNVALTSYAMKAFARILQSFQIQSLLKIESTNQSYYELLENLHKLSPSSYALNQIRHIDEISLDDDIIFLELHPNNVIETKQFPHDPNRLIEKIEMENHNKPRTLVVDITLNALDDREIQDFLSRAMTLVQSGYLNIVLIQSLTKFAQFGLDKRSAGLIVLINDGISWETFNARFNKILAKEKVDPAIESFFNFFLIFNQEQLKQYIQEINKNVRFVYQETLKSLDFLEVLNREKFNITMSSDLQACYVAINMNGLIPSVEQGNFDIEGADLYLMSEQQEESLDQSPALLRLNGSFTFRIITKDIHRPIVVELSVPEVDASRLNLNEFFTQNFYKKKVFLPLHDRLSLNYKIVDYLINNGHIHLGLEHKHRSFSLNSNDAQKFSDDLLQYLIQPLCNFLKLPLTSRSSIGFPLTNVTAVNSSLRFTIGLEIKQQLLDYSYVLSYVAFILNRQQDLQLFFYRPIGCILGLMSEAKEPEVLRELENCHSPSIILKSDNNFELIINRSGGIKRIPAPAEYDLNNLHTFFNKNYNRKKISLLYDDEIIQWITLKGGHAFPTKEREYPLRIEFFKEKLEQFKAMLPGSKQHYKIEFDMFQKYKTRHLKMVVDFNNGFLKVQPEFLGFQYVSPTFVTIPEDRITVPIRNRGDIQITELDTLTRCMIAACFTQVYFPYKKIYNNVNHLIDNLNYTLSFPSFEIINKWNIRLIYGPFDIQNSTNDEVFFSFHQNTMEVILNGTQFWLENVVFEQSSMRVPLTDISIHDQAFLIQAGCYYADNRDQYLPQGYGKTILLNFDDNKLILSRYIELYRMAGVSIYYCSMGKSLSCYEIDYWGEKDPQFSRFLRLMTAIYVKEVLKNYFPNINFNFRNSQFTHFLFNVDSKNVFTAVFKQVVDRVYACKKKLNDLLQKYPIPITQDIFHWDFISWPDGYNPPANVGSISNVVLIKGAFAVLEEFSHENTVKGLINPPDISLKRSHEEMCVMFIQDLQSALQGFNKHASIKDLQNIKDLLTDTNATEENLTGIGYSDKEELLFYASYNTGIFYCIKAKNNRNDLTKRTSILQASQAFNEANCFLYSLIKKNAELFKSETEPLKQYISATANTHPSKIKELLNMVFEFKNFKLKSTNLESSLKDQYSNNILYSFQPNLNYLKNSNKSWIREHENENISIAIAESISIEETRLNLASQDEIRSRYEEYEKQKSNSPQ